LYLARWKTLLRGNERAWEGFLIEYGETLYGAGYGTTKYGLQWREPADSLYSELFGTGLSPRAASEAVSADVRDLEVDVRKFLQPSFQEAKAAAGENR
jgi:hypothetical protein